MFKNPIMASDPPASQELNDALGRWNTALTLSPHSLPIGQECFYSGEMTALVDTRQGLGGLRICPISCFAALCLAYISLNPGADAFPDPEQDCRGTTQHHSQSSSLGGLLSFESEILTPREDRYALSCCRTSSLKHVILALPYPGSRRDEWALVNSCARGEGSGT